MNSDFDMDISDLNPAEVLAALYNAARPLDLGVLQAKKEKMEATEAAEILADGNGWVDYVHGRPLKVCIKDGVLQRYDLYDRDQGRGKAKQVVEELRKAKTRSNNSKLGGRDD